MEGHRVVAPPHVDDSRCAAPFQPVKGGVDQAEAGPAEPPRRVLIRDGEYAGELRRRLARPARLVPGRRPEVRREGEYRAAQRGAHRYIRDSAPEPHDPAHTILIGGPAEDPRHAPAAGPRHR